MGKSAVAMTLDDKDGGLRIEYLKARGVLRLVQQSEPDRGGSAVEVRVDALFAQLGIDATRPAAPRRFLLFAGGGTEAGGGGLRDLVGVFSQEEDARTEFVRVRLEHEGPGAWAELASVDGRGKVAPLCWFGRPPPTAGAGTRTPAPTATMPALHSRRLFRRTRG